MAELRSAIKALACEEALSEIPLSGELRVPEGARAFLLSLLSHLLSLKKEALMILVSDLAEMERLSRELLFWMGEELILCFPELEIPSLPSPSPAASWERMGALKFLLDLGEGKAKPGDFIPLIIAPIWGAMRRTFSPRRLRELRIELEAGGEIEFERFLRKLQELGYRAGEFVEEPGMMARRGGIVDLFPPGYRKPVRLEFWGDVIEDIRFFSPENQRSLERIPRVEILPCSEQEVEGLIFDFLPPETPLVIIDPQAVQEELSSAGELPEGLFARPEDLRSLFGRSLLIQRGEGLFTSPSRFAGGVESFIEEVERRIARKERVMIVSQHSRRLCELLRERGIPILEGEIEEFPRGSLYIAKGILQSGFEIPSFLSLYTDAEIFGALKKPLRSPRFPARSKISLQELSPGDLVVHIDHGIARFQGIATLNLDGTERDYLILEYAEGDRLYVPTEKIDRVARYIGPPGYTPSLHRLGGREWAQTKRKAKEDIEKFVKELLELYLVRETSPGIAFSPDTFWQEELEASFPYEETPDQLKAIEEVKRDMETPKPMDRLVCGDAGCGKTEIAIRAAFKAVQDGFQVAVLVPTTLLAHQHYVNFKERLKPFPVRVEVLSRFLPPQKQREVIEGLRDGSVDICIGTHRLLSQDVSFRNLGLLIVDEEHRFGVAQKEKLRKLRKEVDTLTLSATPIPRTLYMALLGLRDISVIETLPPERLPPRTYCGRYDEELVREAILREMRRGGQVFFVHNRIEDLEEVVEDLRALVPGARVKMAHGRMSEEELEEVMREFVEGEIDVLVCTTIVQAGLDIPNANTIIVDEAEKLGLTQLYHLRGRVGRGSFPGYGYFFYRSRKLTPAAKARFDAILEASGPGSGFKIALRDLELRGAGNILGPEQSGHLRSLGLDLYCRFLAEAAQKGAEKPLPSDVSVSLPLDACFPQSYIQNTSTRLSLYWRLAKPLSPEEVEEMEREIEDLFGPLPPQARNLLYIVRLKSKARRIGISTISQRGGEIVLKPQHGEILERARAAGGRVKVGASQIRLSIWKLSEEEWKEELERLLDFLLRISEN